MLQSNNNTTVYIVIWYEWNSWKSFRTLQSRLFTSLEEAEEFKENHECADDENWYIEIHDHTIDASKNS